MMNPRRIALLASFLLAAACSAGHPRAAGESSGVSSRGGSAPSRAAAEAAGDEDPADAAAPDAPDATDAGVDALDAADAADHAPPPSECDPQMTIGSAALTTSGARFAGITRDERTIAWTVLDADAKTSLLVAERDSADAPFGAPQTLSTDAASDGVALTDDGLRVVAVAADHRHFVVYDRSDRDSDFALGDDSPFDAVVGALAPAERLGDPVFINSDLVLLYSVYGASPDTMRMANRISVYADFYPGSTLAFDAFRAQGDLRRRPTGTGADFQVIFFWDEVSQTEKLARLAGTEYVVEVKDLGAHPWAQANATCSRVYFGESDVEVAAAR